MRGVVAGVGEGCEQKELGSGCDQGGSVEEDQVQRDGCGHVWVSGDGDGLGEND